MAANSGLTQKFINHINRHGSITVRAAENLIAQSGSTRSLSKVMGDVNESLRNNGEEMFIAREGNRYYYYTEDRRAA